MSNIPVSIGNKDIKYVACTNSSTSEILRGTPVRWTSDGYVGVLNSSNIDHFAGILAEDLPASGSSNNILAVEGYPVKVRFLGNASSAVGTWATPVPGATYLTYSAIPTGIVLATDMTADTSVHTATESGAAEVLIYPGALANSIVWLTPATADADGILDGQVCSGAATAVVAASMLLATMGVARGLVVQPKTGTDNVLAGDVVVTGTDLDGAALVASATFLASATGAVAIARAFKTITTVDFPATNGASTWDVGWQDTLGLPRTQVAIQRPKRTLLNNAVETTAPTIVASATLANNTLDPNSACAGTPIEAQFDYPLT